MSAKPYIDQQGRKWHEYECHFTSPDGTYCFKIWAISDQHAQLQIDALRETAVVDGRIIGEQPA